ncbi:ABC transporter substrate-binding protein [Pseudonocardia endophytica]|uniref:Amino acid/amide ABC transporter substrate-binding protein (HAAT family) n=1 Tax=Pseudonocardia endophytica TaxID=401976 RepID=A0A4R1HGE3_PSEEN|nr:ABC transporter substrate-binding protein [Pseudonocardia endophytica]TCK20778.1 amino acid/amide ABC transporter substrate-binding protein (HAAT family) [Pseudonocardia endophytica]
MLRIGAALSLTGRFARFGTQAAAGLQAWRDLDGGAGIEIVDDGSSPASVTSALDALAGRCDVLLGPYGTSTARAAARWARDHDRLVWNHGGAGGDLQVPGRVVPVITPTERYGEAFVRHVAEHRPGSELRLVGGPGTFGPQVIDGMRRTAASLGVPLSDTGDVLFTAGTFEHDTGLIAGLQRSAPGATADAGPDAGRRCSAGPGHRRYPAVVGAVAAGVRAFAEAVPDPEGAYGVAQWMAGAGDPVVVGPEEDAFVARYRDITGSDPDYPAVQAAAAAAIAVHCTDLAGTTDPDALWSAATGLRTTTLYGAFGIDPTTGAQTDHTLTLVRWQDGRLLPVR